MKTSTKDENDPRHNENQILRTREPDEQVGPEEERQRQQSRRFPPDRSRRI